MENENKIDDTFIIVSRQEIIAKIRTTAAANGYEVTDNIDKIANAKLQFFGCKKWARCPCDPDSDRACISPHCKEDIAKDGVCHCNLYRKVA